MKKRGLSPVFWGTAALILAFKLWLSAVIPFTGDEAYFANWGEFPDYGYYDHPPMIGWLLALLLKLSRAEWVLRLPVTLLPFALAAGIHRVLRGADETKATLAALAFILLPANVWGVFITTDTPLIFFCFASAFSFWLGIVVRRSARWQALAGIFLGLAFLSKYLAVLSGLAYVVHVALSPRGQRDWRALALVVLCSLPFAAINLWWNYEHCWANLMFNLYNRHEGAGWSWTTPLIFALTVLYVLSPVALWQLAKERRTVAAALGEPATQFFAVVFAVPFGFFAVLSAVKLIGLHWMLAFVPFFFVAAGGLLSREQLRRSVTYLGTFSAIHVVAIVAAAMLPLDAWKSAPFYDGIVYHARMPDILRELKPYQEEFDFATDEYSMSAVASFHARAHVAVFGAASSHARHDDTLTDFRRLDGRNILVLRKEAPRDADYRPYFRSVEYRERTLSGATFHVVLGRGFDFAAYREKILEPLQQRYYAIPWYLPQGHCYFCERYLGTPTCPAKD